MRGKGSPTVAEGRGGKRWSAKNTKPGGKGQKYSELGENELY